MSLIQGVDTVVVVISSNEQHCSLRSHEDLFFRNCLGKEPNSCSRKDDHGHLTVNNDNTCWQVCAFGRAGSNQPSWLALMTMPCIVIVFVLYSSLWCSCSVAFGWVGGWQSLGACTSEKSSCDIVGLFWGWWRSVGGGRGCTRHHSPVYQEEHDRGGIVQARIW